MMAGTAEGSHLILQTGRETFKASSLPSVAHLQQDHAS